MMKNLSYIPMGLALLAMASCSQDEELQQNDNQATPITFVSSVMQTRSANVNLQKVQIASGVEVGVFVKGAEAYISNGDNAKLTADGNGNFTGTTLYFPTDGSAVSVNAYAPYSTAFTGKADAVVTFSVAADQSSDAGYLKSDLLWGTPAGTNAFTKDNPTVALNFAHKLSKLTVKFTLDNESDADLKGATINIVNTLPTTSLKVSDGTLGQATGQPTAIKAVKFAADATEFVASAVIVPQTVSAGSFVQVVLADKLLNATLGSDATFLSGKSYTYNVNVSGQGTETKARMVLSSVVTDWDDVADELSGEVSEEELPAPEPVTLTATFQTPGSNASYDAPTYTWTGSTSNLMTVFEFAGGELANYHTLKFKFSNLVDGPVRMGYYVGTTFTEFGNGYYSAGEKTVDLTALGIDLSTVTKIAFGGKSNGGSCDILASDVVLIGNADGSTPTDNNGNEDNNSQNNDGKFTATFGTPGGNASYDSTTSTYTWTGSTNNLMSCFTFENGELANYSTLNFSFSELSDGASVRINVLYSDGTNSSKSYYSVGTKATAVSELLSEGKTAADVTAIRFGGNSNSGSVVVKASEMFLE